MTFHQVREQSDFFHFAVPDSQDTICVLPSAVQLLLRTLLHCIKTDKPITKLWIPLIQLDQERYRRPAFRHPSTGAILNKDMARHGELAHWQG